MFLYKTRLYPDICYIVLIFNTSIKGSTNVCALLDTGMLGSGWIVDLTPEDIIEL